MDRKIILVDENTGEKIGDYKPKAAKHKNYHYHIVFYSSYTKATKDIPQLIIGQMDSNNKITLDGGKIKTLSCNYGLNPNTIRMTVCRMCNNGLMMRLSPTVYFANPYYFTKSNMHKVETLRREYAELLFDSRAKTTKAKRINSINKQIGDIKRAKTDPVSRAKDILNNSKPFE